jgi:hypothetical protein
MNIMTIESKNLYLQVDVIKEHLDMANTLYDMLNQKTQNYDFEVLGELNELKQIIYEEKEQFSKGKDGSLCDFRSSTLQTVYFKTKPREYESCIRFLKEK